MDDYEDPVGAVHAEYAGRWIAGFAPVREADFRVIVQQRLPRTGPDGPGVLIDAVLSLALSLLASLGLGLLGWYWWQSRQAQGKTT